MTRRGEKKGGEDWSGGYCRRLLGSYLSPLDWHIATKPTSWDSSAKLSALVIRSQTYSNILIVVTYSAKDFFYLGDWYYTYYWEVVGINGLDF
jgi:hypothetical protein